MRNVTPSRVHCLESLSYSHSRATPTVWRYRPIHLIYVVDLDRLLPEQVVHLPLNCQKSMPNYAI
jgi:hypothetical protein